jgi:hypothetical protein
MQHHRTFIIGSPRSGTTWVAKLFDAHPWVVYRHGKMPGIAPSEALAATSGAVESLASGVV